MGNSKVLKGEKRKMRKKYARLLSGFLAFAVMASSAGVNNLPVFASNGEMEIRYESQPPVWPDEDTSDEKSEVKEIGSQGVATASKWTTETKGDVTYEYKPELVNDGDPSTRWYDGDNKNNGNWVCIDLNKTYGLSEVEIDWSSGSVHAAKYQVQVSEDGENFRSIYTGEGVDGIQKFSVKGYGRYVRLYFVEHGTWGTSIDELRIYGSEEITAEHLEAEDAELLQGENSTEEANRVAVKELQSASGGKYVSGFEQAGNGSGIRFTNQLGNESQNAFLLYLGYAREYYEKEDKISVYVNDEKVGSLNLRADSDNVNITIHSVPFALSLAKGDVISLKVDTAAGDQGFLRMDYVELESQSAADPSEQIQFTYQKLRMPKDATAKLLLDVGKTEDIEFFSEDEKVIEIEGDVATAVGQGSTRIMGRLKKTPSVYALARIEVVTDVSLSQTVLEAEDGILIHGEVTEKPLAVKSNSAASNGKFADNFYDSGNGSGVEFTVPTDFAEAEYDLSVRYARDTYLITTDYMTIWVNGQNAARLEAPPWTSMNDFNYGPSAALTLKGGDKVKVGVDRAVGDQGMYRMDCLKLVESIAVPVASFDITEEKVSVKNKTTLELSYTTDEFSNTRIDWESSNTDVVIVSGGVVRGLSEGSATVTAYSALNPEIRDTVEVSVTPNEDMEILKNDQLEVMIDKSFPQVYEYKLLSNGGVMQGNTTLLDTVKLNGKEYKPEVTYKKVSDAKAEYKLKINELEAEIALTFAVDENDFKMDVTEIKEGSGDDKRIFSFEIPNQKLLSVSSLEKGASFAGSKMESDITKTGDVYEDLTTYRPVNDTVDKAYLYAFLSNEKVSAGIRSNAMPDNEGTGGSSAEERLFKQTVKDGAGYMTSLWSGAWKYRAKDYTKTFQDIEGNYGEPGAVVTKTYKAEYTEELPLVYISFAEDLNKDGKVDWQDSAVAFRDIMKTAIGMENIPDAVVQRLVFPQAGEGNYPYLASLDETKKVFLATDGLGQLVLNKYHNEGNWADLGYYDDKLGGYKDFKKYVDEAANNYNSWVGVHTNFTEIYGKARSFRPEKIMMQSDGITPVGGGYTAYGHWLQQVYIPDVQFNALTLERQKDLVGFKEAVPSLGFVYSDVFSGGGWKGRRLAEDYKAAGFAYFVEWPYQNEAEAVWSHWAVEKSYSPTNLKAYASDIARFIFNHTKDRWDNFASEEEKGGCKDRHPNSANLLMGADTTTYEGWPQKLTNNGFDTAMQAVFDNNLPSKYMQHFPILRMEKDDAGWATHIWFEDNVEVFRDADNGNKRTIKKDGKVIYNEDSYLIPWDEGEINNPDTEEKEIKLYHWNKNGGTTTWEIPNSWSGVETVYLYRLTDLGKVEQQEIHVVDGSITLSDIQAKTAYVIYKGEAAKEEDVAYGNGSCVKDPGFNYGDLRSWTVDKGTPQVRKNDTEFDNTEVGKLVGWGRNVAFGQQRNYELVMSGSDETQVSQEIKGLKPGTYAASVMVEIQQGKQRKASIIIDNGEEIFDNYADKSILLDFDEYDSKIGTYMLRMRVNFEVPQGKDRVTLKLHAEAGEGKVRFDNVRVFETELPNPEKGYAADKVVFYQDFELAENQGTYSLNDYDLNKYKPTYEGYYPFNLGGARGIHETRVSIQLGHAPYTNNGTKKWDPTTVDVDDTLNGDRAIKVIGIGAKGIAVQTLPQTIRFTPGKTYRVTFKYQTQPVDDYQFVLGVGATGLTSSERANPSNLIYRETLEPTSQTKVYAHEFTAESDELWFGIHRQNVSVAVMDNPAPIVLDDILVEEVGGSDTPEPEVPELFEITYRAYQNLDTTVYTEDSAMALAEALAAAEKLKNQADATTEQFQEAAAAIMRAAAGLVLDTTDLEAAAKAAQKAADAAREVAEGAMQAAAKNQETAETAQKAAAAAQAAADKAQSEADKAGKEAQAARDEAAAAQRKAEEAKQKAEEAEKAADEAKKAAEDAKAEFEEASKDLELEREELEKQKEQLDNMLVEMEEAKKAAQTAQREAQAAKEASQAAQEKAEDSMKAAEKARAEAVKAQEEAKAEIAAAKKIAEEAQASADAAKEAADLSKQEAKLAAEKAEESRKAAEEAREKLEELKKQLEEERRQTAAQRAELERLAAEAEAARKASEAAQIASEAAKKSSEDAQKLAEASCKEAENAKQEAKELLEREIPGQKGKPEVC